MNVARTRLLVAFALASALLIGLAVFAGALGIDNDPGWGKGRWLLLAGGGAAALLAAWVAWGPKMETALEPYFSPLFRLPLPAWMRRPPLPAALLLSLGLALLAACSYLWLNTYGRMGVPPIESRYISMLAGAFRHGHLYLDLAPSPELLALENPLDPAQYTTVSALHDASLYQGRYYLYWGPVPALAALLLPADLEFGDNHAALAAGAMLALASGGLLLYAWRRYFPAHSLWAVLPGLGLLFWGMPLPFMYARASVYETVILISQFFLLLGLLCGLAGLAGNRLRPVGALMAGVLWALAAGARITSTAAFVPLAGLLLWGAWRNPAWPKRRVIQGAILVAAPLAIGALALLWYNQARFGSPFETGMCYQLSVVDMGQACRHIFSPRYLPVNLYLYLFRPISIEPGFPFFFMHWLREADFPFFLRLPDNYYFSEPVVGLIFSLPFTLVFSGAAAYQALQRRAGNGAASQLAAALLASALFSWALLLMFFAPMARYLADFSLLLSLAAIIGFWMALQRLQGRSFLRFLVIGIGVLLVAWSISIGFFTGISGTSRAFYETNPALFNLLQRWFAAIGLGP